MEAATHSCWSVCFFFSFFLGGLLGVDPLCVFLTDPTPDDSEGLNRFRQRLSLLRVFRGRYSASPPRVFHATKAEG